MCGISGVIDLSLGTDLAGVTQRMTDALARRGPDGCGLWLDQDVGIGLGHRRLAITDLSTEGSQPMVSHGGRYVLTFNGEIYNHKSMRKEIEAKTANSYWRGASDTETFLQAIEAFGLTTTLAKVKGMFAFGLWDRSSKKLTLCRDRFGEKPLYYGYSTGVVFFASQLKALEYVPSFQRHVSLEAVYNFLYWRYVPAPKCIFDGVFQLEPGSVAEFTVSRTKRDDQHPAEATAITFNGTAKWTCQRKIMRDNDVVANMRFYEKEIESALIHSLQEQFDAAVPVGLLLSGGIDSSTLAAVARLDLGYSFSTFSVGFDDAAYDEAKDSSEIAKCLGTKHSQQYLTPNTLIELYEDLPNAYDEPFGNSSQIATLLVSRLAKREVKVVLSGDGADEIFAGYNRYKYGSAAWKTLSMLGLSGRMMIGGLLVDIGLHIDRPSPLKKTFLTRFFNRLGIALPGPLMAKLGSALLNSQDFESFYDGIRSERICGLTTHDGANPIYDVIRQRRPSSMGADGKDLINWMMLADLQDYLPNDSLTKVDRGSMHYGLEVRLPYLHQNVVEIAEQLDNRFKIRRGITKYPLRRILGKRLPKRLFSRPKSGFALPIAHWLRGPLHGWAEERLRDSVLYRDGLFSRSTVMDCWRRHYRGQADHSAAIWNLLVLAGWLQAQRSVCLVK